MEDRDFILLKSMYYSLSKLSETETLPIQLLYWVEKAKEEVEFISWKIYKLYFSTVEGLHVNIFDELEGYELLNYLIQFYSLSKGNVVLIYPGDIEKITFYMGLLELEYVKVLTRKQ